MQATSILPKVILIKTWRLRKQSRIWRDESVADNVKFDNAYGKERRFRVNERSDIQTVISIVHSCSSQGREQAGDKTNSLLGCTATRLSRVDYIGLLIVLNEEVWELDWLAIFAFAVGWNKGWYEEVAPLQRDPSGWWSFRQCPYLPQSLQGNKSFWTEIRWLLLFTIAAPLRRWPPRFRVPLLLEKIMRFVLSDFDEPWHWRNTDATSSYFTFLQKHHFWHWGYLDPLKQLWCHAW